MTLIRSPRVLSRDWYGGQIPDNVVLDETTYIETAFSFYLYRSEQPVGVRIGRGASTYLGTMFDVGPRGQVVVGEYTLVHGARIICDAEINIGDYCLISWNVVLMDTYRLPFDISERRCQLDRVSSRVPRRVEGDVPARSIRIGDNVWIGFDTCILPGVTIGEGSIVGARSVVTEDVAPYSIVAGNPARFIRKLDVR
jgi:carbonic anhydrase/acetyltransferase-like protein (isoleucine patch superfamily)